jgi:hypothetical protein
MNMLEDLAEMIRNHNEFKEAEPRFVSIYRRCQHFGGPEEGGWWYSRDSLEGSIPFPTKEDAEKWLEEAKRQVEKQNEIDAPKRHRAMANLPDEENAYYDEGFIPTGWTDGGELWVTIEEVRGASDDSREPRPHYE